MKKKKIDTLIECLKILGKRSGRKINEKYYRSLSSKEVNLLLKSSLLTFLMLGLFDLNYLEEYQKRMKG